MRHPKKKASNAQQQQKRMKLSLKTLSAEWRKADRAANKANAVADKLQDKAARLDEKCSALERRLAHLGYILEAKI